VGRSDFRFEIFAQIRAQIRDLCHEYSFLCRMNPVIIGCQPVQLQLCTCVGWWTFKFLCSMMQSTSTKDDIQARIVEAKALQSGDVIKVDGEGWSDISGHVEVKSVTLVYDRDHRGIIDATVVVKKLNRSQNLPSPCSGGSYFSVSKNSFVVKHLSERG
jgi:hypothetical protein